MLKSLSLTLAVALAAGTAFAAEPAGGPPTVKDGMFVNSAGMTVYIFDKDQPGKSVCNGPCAVNWPPLAVGDNARPMGDWTIVMRDDGLKQWAYKGKPLYYWVKDTQPGERTGDPFDDLNPASLEVVHGKAEAALADTPAGAVVQFERLGYFAHDPSVQGQFHRTVGLKDEWANVQKRA